jgi:hypothetical protein
MDENKFQELLKVSDPLEVDKRAMIYYGRPTQLSTRKYKKYMIQDDWGKWHHFGDIRYADFTRHKNSDQRIRYKKRMMAIKGKWREDEFSPNWLSLRLLW